MYILPSDLSALGVPKSVDNYYYHLISRKTKIARFFLKIARFAGNLVPRGFWEREPNGGNMEVMIVDC